MNSFLFTEIAISILFLFLLIWIWKKDKQNFLFFIFTVLYAALFENINIYLSRNIVGGYFYNSKFLFFIFDTPLFIIFSWAIIIYGAKKITEILSPTQFAKPFIASLIVLMIDLSLDAVAIRLNFWTWRGYSLTDGFLGVPANNFLGWLFVAFTFFFVYQNLSHWKKEFRKLLATCFLAFTFFLIIFSLLTTLEFWLNLTKNSEFILLIFTLLIFLLPAFSKNKTTKNASPDKNLNIIFISRWCFHFFSLFAILYFQIYQKTPFLLFWTLLLIVLEIFLEILAKNRLTCGKLLR